MDDEDAETIDKKLTDFEDKELMLATVIKDHEAVEELYTATSKTQSNQIIDEHINLILHLLNVIRNDYDTLITAVLLAKRGILHPSIMSPYQLREIMIKLMGNIPSGLESPIPKDEENSHLILDLINLVAYYCNNKLVFIIKIPLLPIQNFDIYETISIPTRIINNSYIFIQPNHEYFAIRKDKQEFTTITEEELSKCKKLENRFMCVKFNPTFNSQLKSICEAKLFLLTSSEVPKNCDVRIVNFQYNMWHKLQNKNSWLYITKIPTTVTIACNNSENPIDTIINQSGILTMKSNCKVYSGSITLEATKIHIKTLEKQFIPPMNICDILCDNDRINKINLTSNKITINNLHIVKLENLDILSTKLNQMEQIAERILSKEKIEVHSNFLISLTVFIVVIIAVMLLIILRKRFKRSIKINITDEIEMDTMNTKATEDKDKQKRPVRRSSRLFSRHQSS
ncbi:uncharacterized protein LOC122520375 [Polistes fuscatus]|uniref:uncharacterized protein LOC122520375 n=1 Tax=Polistes fuscatus TaxID=30207 RepID=UPI001CA7D2C5|nr:uncharacterized protein LOC122520375 [Polistes fuscatus]